MYRLRNILLAVGVTCFAFGVIGLIILTTWILPNLVRNSVALRNGTETYKQFVSPTVPVRMQFYVWHLANLDEVLHGDRPYLVERGPFTYAEIRVKFDISYNPDLDWITYKQNRTFIFLRNESIADDRTLFTTANLPVVTILNALKYQPSNVRRALSMLLSFYPNETLFVTKSVRDVIFGYRDPLLKLAKLLLPAIFYTDYVGVMAGLNHTFDGVYTIAAGNVDTVHLGEIQAFNGTRKLKFWSSDLANTIYGSDGTLAPPFINKTAKLPCFISDICRSLYGIYDGETTAAGGITLWKFSGPDVLLANATEYPPNAGYCTPSGNCLPTGVFNISNCKLLDGFHIPIIVSLPHFLQAESRVIDNVIGMRPDNVSHRTYVNLEPITGLVLQVYKRLQINVYMEHSPEYGRMGRVRTMFYPIVWMNESSVVDESTAQLLISMLFTPRSIAYASLTILTVFGTLFTATYVVIISCLSQNVSTSNSSDQQTLVNDSDAITESVPALDNHVNSISTIDS